MKIGREELASAIKLANTVAGAHSISSFTQVWLRKGKVSACNGLIGIDVEVEGLPEIGGIDGKPMVQLLTNSAEDEISIRLEDSELRIVDGNSKAAITVMESDAYINTAPEFGEYPFQIPTATFEDIQLDTMLAIRDLKNDIAKDLTTLSLHPNEDKITLFTCDRISLRRSIIKVDDRLPAVTYIPLEFMRLLKKLWTDMREGELAITDKHVIACSEDDAIRLYSKLQPVETPLPLHSIVDGAWPDGKYSKKLMIPIPDNMRDAVAKAYAIASDKEDVLRLKIVNDQIILSYTGSRSKFNETVKFEGNHAPIEVGINLSVFATLLQQTERMYITHRAAVLLGPHRFAVFIAPRF